GLCLPGRRHRQRARLNMSLNLDTRRNAPRWIVLSALLAGALGAGYLLGRHASPPAAIAVAAASAGAQQAPDPDFVRTALPVAQSVPETIPVTGKLMLDRQRLRIAASRVAGRLGRVFAGEGEAVLAGQVLAEVYSPDFISAQNE